MFRSIIFFLAISLFPAYGLSEDITIIKYFDASGHEISLDVANALIERNLARANRNGAKDANGVPMYDHKYRRLKWPVMETTIIEQQYYSDGKPVYSPDGKFYVYDHGPAYMKRRRAAEKKAAIEAAEAKKRSDSIAAAAAKLVNDRDAAEMAEIKKRQDALNARIINAENQNLILQNQMNSW